MSAPNEPAPEAFDPLIDGFTAVAMGHDEGGALRKALEDAMESMAKEGIDIREPIKRIWAGERDHVALTKGLTPTESIPVRGTLAALESGSITDLMESLSPELQEAIMSGDEDRFADALESMSDEEQAAMFEKMAEAGLLGEPNIPADGPLFQQMAEPLLIAIAEVANGADDGEIKGQIDEELAFLAECGHPIGDAVHRIWNGERDAAALTTGLSDESALLVNRILELIATP